MNAATPDPAQALAQPPAAGMAPATLRAGADGVHNAARWQLRLLGDVVLSAARGGPQRLPGRAATALLARLALAPGRAQPRQVLSTLKSLLDAPGHAGGAGAAGTTLISADRQWQRLAGNSLQCDAVAFDAAMRAGRLAEARALYRGELLPGFYDEWILDERNRLARLAERLGHAPAAAALREAPPLMLHQLPVHGPSALNLPHDPTQLHGVDAVGARLRADVLAHRLVTLMGPGGFGKTRLAVEVVQTLAHSLAHSLALGDVPAVAVALALLALACQACVATAWAAALLNTADRHDLRRMQRLCRAQASAAAVAHWWAEGAALLLAQAVHLALQPALQPAQQPAQQRGPT